MCFGTYLPIKLNGAPSRKAEDLALTVVITSNLMYRCPYELARAIWLNGVNRVKQTRNIYSIPEWPIIALTYIPTSTPSNTKVKNVCSYTSTHPMCLHGADSDNVIFTFTCSYWMTLRCWQKERFSVLPSSDYVTS